MPVDIQSSVDEDDRGAAIAADVDDSHDVNLHRLGWILRAISTGAWQRVQGAVDLILGPGRAGDWGVYGLRGKCP